ncbi:hypothetical protein [Deinococcus sp. YIM 77859]|uniref:hypothetical protein n=1 Tax=Deinococcus sp. YIM 77859 TaxID=1540221 RepID=UPI00054E58B9|nr:hypothetical protein [Deinococcus sp. YIM 77859]
MKPILPRVHGLIDYAACALMVAAPHLLDLHPGARRISYALAGSYLGVSALTDYPPALRRLLPFPVHGKIELSTLPVLLLAAALQKETRERAYFLALAGTVAGIYSLTDWQADPDA